MSLRLNLYLLIALLLSGCPKTDEGQNYPAWVAQELSGLKSEITLGQWKKSHSNEQVVIYAPGVRPGINIGTSWCAKTEVTTTLPDGDGAIRYAVFYPPLAPATLALPSDVKTEESLIDNQCNLGLIWIEQNELSERRGNKIALQIRQAIDKLFGMGQSDIVLDRIDATYLSCTGRWKKGDAVFVSAYQNFPPTGKVIMALGYLPSSGFYGDGDLVERGYVEETRENRIQRIREAAKIANISEQDSETFIKYIQTEGGSPKLNPGQADPVVRLLEKWVTASEKLDKTRKAGALIAADQVLSHMAGSLGTTDVDKGLSYRQRLEKLGAKFSKYEQESSVLYDHSWLQAARDIDIDGPMGDVALLIQMEIGDTWPNIMLFEDVVKQGEAYLEKGHNKAIRAEIEFMVAEGYRDLVALAAGAEHDRPENYKERVVDARKKAIMHYRNAIPLLKPSRSARHAWREAWRLLVGLPPASLRFYPVYD